MADLEIGKVSIRVIPNIKGFKRKVEQEMSQLRDVELDVAPDMDGFRRKVKAGTKGLKATVDVNANTRSLPGQIKNAMDRVAQRKARIDTALVVSKQEVRRHSAAISSLLKKSAVPVMQIGSSIDWAIGGQASRRKMVAWLNEVRSKSADASAEIQKIQLPEEMDTVRRSTEAIKQIEREIQFLKTLDGVRKKLNKNRKNKQYDPALHAEFNSLERWGKSLRGMKSGDSVAEVDRLVAAMRRFQQAADGSDSGANRLGMRLNKLQREFEAIQAAANAAHLPKESNWRVMPDTLDRKVYKRIQESARRVHQTTSVVFRHIQKGATATGRVVGKSFILPAKGVRSMYTSVADDVKGITRLVYDEMDKLDKKIETNKLSRFGRVTNIKSVVRDVRELGNRFRSVTAEANKSRASIDRVAKATKRASGGFAARRKGLRSRDDFGTEKFAGLSRLGWIVAAVSAVAAPLIQLVSGAIAALPSLGLAAAAALGATVLGWEGIKDAAGAAAPAVERAKTAMSDVFRERLTPQFAQLGGTLDHILPNLTRLGHGMSDFSQGMVDAVSKGRGLNNVNEIVGRTATLFSDLKPFAHDFTAGLLEMGAAGSRAFPKLAEGLNSFGSTFRNAVEEMSDSGALQQAIESTYTVLGSAGMNMGRIMREGIESFTPEVAASVDDLFTGFADGITGLMPLFSELSQALFPILGDLFSGIGTVGEELAGEVASMSASISEHAPNLEESGARIRTALDEMFPPTRADGSGKSFLEQYLGGPLWTDQDSANLDKLVQGVATVTEHMATLKRDLGEMFDFSDFGNKIGQIGNIETDSLFNGLERAIAQVKEKSQALASELQIDITPEIRLLEEATNTGEFEAAKRRIIDKLKAAQLGEAPEKTEVQVEPDIQVSETADVGGKVASAVAPVKDQANAAITEGLSGLGTEMGAAVDTELQAAMSQMDASVATAAEGIGVSLGTALGGITIPTEGLTTVFSTSLTTAFAGVTIDPSVVQAPINSALSGVTFDASGITAALNTAVTSATDAAKAAAQLDLTETGVQGGTTMADGITSTVGAVTGAATSLKSAAQSATAGISLFANGAAAGQSFADGISSKAGAVSAAAASLAAAVKANMPSSPAKEGPLSGKGYTDQSGIALAKDFAKGMLSQTRTVSDAAGALAGAVHKNMSDIAVDPVAGFEAYHRKQVLDPVLESNAKKIHDWRKRQEDAEKKSVERIDKINEGKQDQVKKEESISKERERLAKSDAESYEKLLESLEEPDYSKIDRSFKAYWVDGLKDQMQDGLLKAVADTDLSGSIRKVSLGAVDTLRKTFGDHPVYAQVEANVNAEHFNSTISRVIEESGIAYIPVEFAFSNLDQFKSDLGMGDGVISRGITAAMEYDPSRTDARYAEENKTEIHYHVTDMEEAIRLEQQRERKEMMKYA